MGRVTVWAEERSAPVVATVVMLVLVMAYSLLGHSVLHGGPAKLLSPSDLWSLAASSSALAHGHFSHIYVRNGALTSPPAFEVVLAPVLLAGQALGLSPHLRVSGQPLSLWFVLGPAALLLCIERALRPRRGGAALALLRRHPPGAGTGGRTRRGQRGGGLGTPRGLRGRCAGGVGRARARARRARRRAPRRPPPRRRRRVPAARPPGRGARPDAPRLAGCGAPVVASRAAEPGRRPPGAGGRAAPHALRAGAPALPAPLHLLHAPHPPGAGHRTGSRRGRARPG